jgi:hypothetical protein
MTLSRITYALGAAVLCPLLSPVLSGALVSSTYGAHAASPPAPPAAVAVSHRAAVRATGHFQPPVAHRYGANGMRMGLHCEDHDPS